MPVLIAYQGKPVKRREHQPDGRLKLVFYSSVPGKPGEQLIVTDPQWKKHGSEQFYKKEDMPDVRAMVRQSEAASSLAR